MPRAMTKELYDRAVEYFRSHPGDSAGCARHIGVHYRTARKMWTQDSEMWPWMKGIEKVLAEEKSLEISASEQREQDRLAEIHEETEKARKIEQEARMFEERALSVARADILQGLAAVGRLTRGINKLTEDVSSTLERGVDARGNPLKLDVGKCLNLIRSYTSSVRGLTQATETLVNLGRVQRDLPTTIVGLEVQSITLEDAQREVNFAERALQRAKALGLGVVETHGESVD
jgi:hypothetical protein